jgi:hypothetical protein
VRAFFVPPIVACVFTWLVVVSLQPTLYYKNMIQQQRPWKFLTPPRELYRGLFAATMAQVGELGLQFLLTGMVKKVILGEDVKREMTNGETMGAALLGGALSAVYTSPAELVMIQQQNFGGSAAHTLGRIVTTTGVTGLTRGFFAASMRDGAWTLGLLGFTPLIQDALIERYKLNQSVAGFAASLAAGTACGILSCPFDVVKTSQQGDLAKVNFSNFANTVWKQRKRLFSGVEWRIANVIGTIMIANEFRTRVAPLLFPSKF